MRRLLVAATFVCFVTGVSAAENVQAKIRAALYDRDLNLKPVPRLLLKLVPTAPGAQEITVQTTLDGIAETEVPAGSYSRVADKPVEMFDKTYPWEFEASFTKPENTLELSNDIAKMTPLAGAGR